MATLNLFVTECDGFRERIHSSPEKYGELLTCAVIGGSAAHPSESVKENMLREFAAQSFSSSAYRYSEATRMIMVSFT